MSTVFFDRSNTSEQHRYYDTGDDYACTYKFMQDLFLMEYELAGENGDKAAGLLNKRHDGNFAVGVRICNKQAAVGDNKKYCKQPDPVVFKGGS